ncbi:MAG: hypothetical protein IJG84_24245 [Kiritimatiellae bacterium]|nr:hypothetical protein [Kiritimatiellia bacterium]
MKTLKLVTNKLKMTVVTALAFACGTAIGDSDGTWVSRAGVGTSGTNWANWSDADNWDGGSPANGSTGVADLSVASGRYINITSATSLKRILGTAAPLPVIRSDSTVTIYNSGNGLGSSNVWIYAPFAFNGSSEYCGINGFQICGQCVSINKEPLVSPENKFRFDLYATAAGGTRSETVWPKSLNCFGESAFYFIAPRGSESDITANWSMVEGSPFLSRAAGQAEHVLSVGTLVTGAGVPDGTYLKRVFPDGTIELSAAATATAASSAITFAAFDSKMVATINGNMRRGPSGSSGSSTCTIYVQKYREADELTVSTALLRTSSATAGKMWSFKISTESGFFPGMLSLAGVQIPDGVGQLPLLVTLEDCHLRIAGDSFANANFIFPGASHVARLTVAAGESHSMGPLNSLKGTLRKDGGGTLSACMTNSASSYTGTLVVEEGVFSVANANAYIANVTIRSGATLDVPEGLHIGTLVAEAGACLSGGAVTIDSASAETLENITLKGAYILDAIPSDKPLELTLLNGAAAIHKVNSDDAIATFSSNSLVRINGCGYVDVLVVGGGGGGGTVCGGGGGGGGVVYRQKLFLTNGVYGVVVGEGGAGTDSRMVLNGNGGDSMFGGLIAYGGGAGGTWWKATDAGGDTRGDGDKGHIGVSGASGGGGGIMYPANGQNRSAAGGSGIVGQGHDGGSSFNYGYSNGFWAGGGGGGAGGAGQNAATNSVGNFIGSCGGDGVLCAITGEDVYYGGGGGGAGNKSAVEGSGLGGRGGGGNGSFGADRARGTQGIDGLGGGGGGGRSNSVDGDPQYSGGGAKGGDGVVIIRYPRIKKGFVVSFR